MNKGEVYVMGATDTTSRFPIDLDESETLVWVLEVKYDGGSLRREILTDESDAKSRYRFARDRASTEWQQLWEVTLHTGWRSLERSEVVGSSDRDKTWLDDLTREELLAAYGEWVDSKVQDGDGEQPLSFADWLEMEKSIAGEV